MIKDVILIPEGKCPLDVLAEMGEQTRNAWIFLHDNAVRKLNETANSRSRDGLNHTRLVWHATEKYPAADMCIDTQSAVDEWRSVTTIDASDIEFKQRAIDPDNIFFLKMEE